MSKIDKLTVNGVAIDASDLKWTQGRDVKDGPPTFTENSASQTYRRINQPGLSFRTNPEELRKALSDVDGKQFYCTIRSPGQITTFTFLAGPEYDLDETGECWIAYGVQV